MSKKEFSVKLMPQMHGLGINKAMSRKELMTFEGFVCPCCRGDGRVLSSDFLSDMTYDVCPVCKGSGELVARVSIEWLAKGDLNKVE